MARPTLMKHRKFLRLASLLGSAIVARGALEILWDSAYESGDDRLGTPEDVELVAGWDGEPGKLSRALIACGFVDRVSDTDLRVHDLFHHAPEYVKKRRERELARTQRLIPSAKRRRTANGGGQRRTVDAISGQLPGLDHTPAPARAPAPALAPALENVCAEPSNGSTPPANLRGPSEVRGSSPTVLEFPTTGQGGPVWRLSEAKVAEWAELYPALDIRAQCREALAWVRAQPARRKTAGGMEKFLVAWFSRSQNRGGGSVRGATPLERLAQGSIEAVNDPGPRLPREQWAK